MKTKVSENQRSSSEAVRKVIKEVWVKELSRDYCFNVISSMPRRLQEAIKNKGDHARYKKIVKLVFF